MAAQELFPGGLLCPVRRRVYARFLQYLGDGATPDFVAQVLQGALNARIAACKSLSKVEFTPKLMKFSVYSSLFEGN